jgi:hypothetical protein
VDPAEDPVCVLVETGMVTYVHDSSFCFVLPAESKFSSGWGKKPCIVPEQNPGFFAKVKDGENFNRWNT